VLGAVTEPLAPVTGGLLSPVADVLAPVTGIVGGVTSPILRALDPVTAPVTGALAPILAPVGGILAPVGGVLAPVVEPLSPIVAPIVAPLAPVLEPLPPVPGVLVPELPAAPTVPGGPVVVVPVVQTSNHAEPTDPGSLQASGDVADVVVRASVEARHAMLDLMRAGVPTGTAATQTLGVAATVVAVNAGGSGLLGAGLPLAAGGAGNAVVASAGGVLGGGAPQLKLLGGDLIAVLSALLVFRARAWGVSTDESRGKLSSRYTDIPVSPA